MGSDRTHWRTGTCVRNDVIEQVRRCLRHVPGPARRAEAASFAAEGHKLVVAAVTAAQRQEAVGQDAAVEEGVELVTHKLRQAGAGCRFGLLDEGGAVLLHQPVQRGLSGAVKLVVDRCAVRRPDRRIGLPTDGLHASLPRW